ncbi:MAG: 30S ribosomal protein S6 [Lachnospiraceae bacterium]|nr:30S ribosomal protein S6 [Candidatus Minthocola equi]
MNKYEFTLVLSSKIEDEERAQALQKVQDYITRFGGTLGETDEWGLKKLAYDIQGMSEAYYYFIHFESAADVPGQLEESVRIMEPVIRYLCVKTDEA